jgi:hypothetical protein
MVGRVRTIGIEEENEPCHCRTVRILINSFYA